MTVAQDRRQDPHRYGYAHSQGDHSRVEERGVDVLTAQEDGASILEDAALLQRATELRRIWFTFDDDLLVEADRPRREHASVAGLVFTRFQGHSFRRCIEDLELLAKASDQDDRRGR